MILNDKQITLGYVINDYCSGEDEVISAATTYENWTKLGHLYKRWCEQEGEMNIDEHDAALVKLAGMFGKKLSPVIKHVGEYIIIADEDGVDRYFDALAKAAECKGEIADFGIDSSEPVVFCSNLSKLEKYCLSN